MKIRFIKDSGLSDGTINLIKALPNDNRFKQSVKTTRDVIGVPTESFLYDMGETARYLKGRSLYKDKLVSNKVLLALGASTLVREFSLPENWVGVMEELLLFDSVLVFEEEIVLALPEKIIHGNPPFIGINIYGRITRNKLDTWLNQNWDLIEHYFEAFKFKQPSKINRKLANVMIEAVGLYESKKPSKNLIKDISDELSDKYRDDEQIYKKVTDVEIVRNWIMRVKSDIED